MSEPLKQVKFNSPPFFSMPRDWQINSVTPLQITEEITRDMQNSVQRNLENHYSRSKSSKVREQDVNDDLEHNELNQVIVKRNYLLVFDISLFEPNTERNIIIFIPKMSIERNQTPTSAIDWSKYRRKLRRCKSSGRKRKQYTISRSRTVSKDASWIKKFTLANAKFAY